MDVSIIVVNYNTAEIIRDCVKSVLVQCGINFEIIVVDNASNDDSAELLTSLSATNIKIVLNPENVGFGRANNQAFRRCSGRYIFLLNPDAALLTPHDLQKLVVFMDQNLRCGLAGTRILKEDGQESVPFPYYPGEKALKQKLAPLPGDIAWVLGASMIIRRELYAVIGGFDEDYFLYAEEADLCLRIRQQRFVVSQCENVAVKHIGGISESNAPIEHVQRKKQAARYLFYKKHYSQKEISHLVQRDFARARFRLLPLIVQKYCGGLSERQYPRYHKYKAIYATAKAFIDAQRPQNITADTNVL